MLGVLRMQARRQTASAMVAMFLAVSACNRNYIYDAGAPPTLEGKSLVVDGATEKRLRVKSIAVADGEDWGRWRLASSDELAYLRAGSLPPSASAVRINVDNSAEIWGEWAMGGFGLGVTAAFGFFAAFGALNPANQFQSFDFGIVAIVALVFGLEMALIGAGIGELFAGQDVDMRLGGPRD